MPTNFLQRDLRRGQRANRIGLWLFYGFLAVLVACLVHGVRSLAT